ncbi:MAG: alpha-1,2-fucosyltransferase [Candidatus Latescibacteria bacterium]|nr:alpha-1,2-fucosyltransferase [Candidatus Latescibacterota bacterium]
MIKVIVSHRTGNQMFQYAVGRHLAQIHRCPLYLDISSYGKNKSLYILPRFNISGKTLNPLPSLLFRKIFKQNLWQYSSEPIYYEKDRRFDKSVLTLPKSCTLAGFFQSEKYFKPSADIIRSEFSFNNFPVEKETLEVEKKIVNTNSVSIHVRRGDYLKIERFKVCTEKYYEKAMNLIRDKENNPVFYVFSDDIQWCINNFHCPDCIYIDPEQSHNDPLNDMRLMSLCKHNIIANSSYSWWGAWLNNNPEKNIVCPYIWLNKENAPIEDKLCDGWIKLEF